MLSDLERKVLRICYNYSVANRRPPTIRELCIKTGKPIGRIKFILHQLTAKQFLEWNPERHGEMRVIQAWEFNFGR
ncbi:hypothetical protein [Paenibacillus pinihumi]|uniref:hypothetical protein n=1 Tax=Paenibacillus pinihumi TaxID=669462 RepID=UPI0004261970|nr:hypothetical protein [Paenibacillus pinihumi]